jgi:hypothetical protein
MLTYIILTAMSSKSNEARSVCMNAYSVQAQYTLPDTEIFINSLIHSQELIVQDGPLASLFGFLDHTYIDTR